MEESKKTIRGGFRPGAGRPKVAAAEKKVTLSVTMPPELKEKIMDDAKRSGLSLSAYVAQLLQEKR